MFSLAVVVTCSQSWHKEKIFCFACVEHSYDKESAMASSWTAMGKAPEEKMGLQDEQQEIRSTSFPKAFGFALKAPPTEPRKMNHGIVIQKPKLAPQSPPKKTS